jgi:hypothetical protein
MTRYARPALAAQIADDLTGTTFLSDSQNGLFLAAPRRTGKTDFLKHDLKPELENRGLQVMYVDLWSDKKRSPSDLIADAIALALEASLGMVAKAAKGAGLKTIKLFGTLEVDTSKIGKIDGLTLPQALQLLHTATKQRLVLMIDEAQHALTSSEGENAMSALKSARDQMRNAEGSQLLLVMSGSHQDKLSRLVNTPAAPFWGSQVQPLPKLGEGFAKQIANEIRSRFASHLSISDELLWHAFEGLGERPQFFMDEVAKALKSSVDAPSFNNALLAAASSRQKTDRLAFDEQFKSLKKEERVLLWRLLDQGSDFRASDASSLKFYEAQLGKKLTPVQVQRFLEKMRDLDSPMVWKSSRGDYSLYDTALADWYSYRQSEQAWASLIA